MAAKDISQERLSDMSDLENDAVPDTFHDNEYNADQTTAGNNVADSRNTDKGDINNCSYFGNAYTGFFGFCF